jgi:hypothetical protein
MADFKLTKETNIHQLALKKNFFGLYHFSDSRNNPLPILIGCLLARNFVLFTQLLGNCNINDLYSYRHFTVAVQV